jgi:hypothetical protein
VELLSTTLDGLAGEASWAEWSAHLEDVCERWIGAEQDREAVIEVVADLAGLASVSPRAAWADVERVVEARFEWERVPMTPPSTGGVHIGVLDAMAGLPFRLVVIPGLVEGGYRACCGPIPFSSIPSAKSWPEPQRPRNRLLPTCLAHPACRRSSVFSTRSRPPPSRRLRHFPPRRIACSRSGVISIEP